MDMQLKILSKREHHARAHKEIKTKSVNWSKNISSLSKFNFKFQNRIPSRKK